MNEIIKMGTILLVKWCYSFAELVNLIVLGYFTNLLGLTIPLND